MHFSVCKHEDAHAGIRKHTHIPTHTRTPTSTHTHNVTHLPSRQTCCTPAQWNVWTPVSFPPWGPATRCLHHSQSTAHWTGPTCTTLADFWATQNTWLRGWGHCTHETRSIWFMLWVYFNLWEPVNRCTTVCVCAYWGFPARMVYLKHDI